MLLVYRFRGDSEHPPAPEVIRALCRVKDKKPITITLHAQ